MEHDSDYRSWFPIQNQKKTEAILIEKPWVDHGKATHGKVHFAWEGLYFGHPTNSIVATSKCWLKSWKPKNYGRNIICNIQEALVAICLGFVIS